MKKIICYGEALIDFTQQGAAFVPHPGGSSYNVAIALGRLGSQVSFCSQLSNDMFGKQLYQYLAANQVAVDNIILSPAPTTLAFVSTPINVEPEYAFYSNGAADVLIDDKSGLSLLNADIHHFGSISLMQEPCGTFWADYLTQCEGFVSFDPNIRPSLIPDREAYLQRFSKIVSNTDMLRLSLIDLLWLAPGVNKEDFAYQMCAAGVKMVAITAGNDGAWLYTPQYCLHQPALDIDVTDTIGAGDSFTAGVLSVLAQQTGPFSVTDKELMSLALKTGCIAAALNCQKKGANPPDKTAVDAQFAVGQLG